jgi:DNA invertase Pin-like site-specific DNA recombinase
MPSPSVGPVGRIGEWPNHPPGFGRSLFGSLAQFERSLIQERVQAGLAAARRRGRHGGRPTAIGAKKLAAVTAALDDGATKAALCRTFGIKRAVWTEIAARTQWITGCRSPFCHWMPLKCSEKSRDSRR